MKELIARCPVSLMYASIPELQLELIPAQSTILFGVFPIQVFKF